MNHNYSSKKAYFELHSSVFLWGFTGILGRLITIDSTLLVWYRLFFTVISFLAVKNSISALKTFPKKVLVQFIGIGIIASLHWVTFYGAIHISNVSVAVGCLATTSLFTSFIEPILKKTSIQPIQVLTGIFVTAGLGIMFFYGQNYLLGIFVGLLSAFLAGLFTTLNKIAIDEHSPNPRAMTFIEMSGGLLFLSLLLPIYMQFVPINQLLPKGNDFIYLFILSFICTTVPFILSLRSLKKLSAFDAVLAINLEPIYSIVLAILLFNENEELNWKFYLGTIVVVFSVLLFPILRPKLLKNK